MSISAFRCGARHTLTAIRAFFAAGALLALGAAHAAQPRSRGEIVVVTVHGTVSATMAGATTPLYAGAILQLPATIRTGHDGALELRQGSNTFAAAANTELEIPQSAAADGLIERIIQIRGNAFYNVDKRERSRLRVEAPYLVAVIKGTQFNVAAQEDSTTIALFEGRLEVRATDESDVVDLHAGEIAIRHRGDVSISVLRLTAGMQARRAQGALVAESRPGASTPAGVDLGAPNTSDADTQNIGRDQIGVSLAPPVPADTASFETGAVSAGVDLGANVAGATVAVGAGATVDPGAGSVTADLGVGADLGGASAAASAGAAVDLSAGSVTADIGAGVDVGADVDVGAGIDVGSGGVSVDVGVGDLDLGVGVGSDGLDLGLGAGADGDDSGDGLGLLRRPPRN